MFTNQPQKEKISEEIEKPKEKSEEIEKRKEISEEIVATSVIILSEYAHFEDNKPAINFFNRFDFIRIFCR